MARDTRLPEQDGPLDEAGSAAGQGAIPSSEEVLVALGHGALNLPRELFTGSKDPVEFLVRSRFSEQEIDTMQEILATEEEVYKGRTDMRELFQWRANALAGRNGEARRELVDVLTHQPLNPFRRRGLSGLLHRTRNPDGSQEGG